MGRLGDEAGDLGGFLLATRLVLSVVQQRPSAPLSRPSRSNFVSDAGSVRSPRNIGGVLTRFARSAARGAASAWNLDLLTLFLPKLGYQSPI